MKKLLSLFLALILILGVGTTLAEDVVVNIFGLKIEILPQLQKYAEWYNQNHPGVKIVAEGLGGGADYGAVIKSKNQAGKLPTIIQIEGQSGYNDWKDYAVTLDDAKFVEKTELSFKNEEGKIVGFPVAIEGYGVVYNKDILDKAGVDPETLTTRQAYQAAFEKIDSMKEELGLDAVVAGATSTTGGMWWSMGQHVFSSYFSGGLEYGDRTRIDLAIKEGKVDESAFREFVEYLALLMKYSEPTILSTGDYNAQLTAFATQKTAFILQGNWIDPNLKQLGVNFKMGFAPHAFLSTEDKGLQLNPPSWYLVTNAASSPEQIQAAKDFLDSIALTKEGQEYMVTEAGMVPAFSGIDLKPEGQLSQDLLRYNNQGGNHNWFFGEFPVNFALNEIGPVLDLYAQNPQDINVDDLYKDLAEKIAKMPELLSK